MRTKIRLAGYNAHECGYCGSKADDSVSFGVVSDQLLCQDYNDMMMVGWRRSGTYLYKPTNHATCCPAYTIRLSVNDFKANKKQRQLLKKMDRYLETGSVLVKPPSAAAAVENVANNTSKDDDNVDLVNHAPKEINVETVKARFTQESFELYRKYQIAVHHDSPGDVTEKGFTRFLVDSPLVNDNDNKKKNAHHNYEYGSYHQLYRINGKLVAIGVIDILPTGLSSVYLIYDPDERHLVLGKFTAMKEIEFCKENNLQFYYMGFYIHDCEKMKYKAEYSPSELLCPTTLNWFSFDHSAKCMLDKGLKFVPLEPTAFDERMLLLVQNNTDKDDKIEASVVDSDSDLDNRINSNPLSNFAPKFPDCATADAATMKFAIGDTKGLVVSDLHEKYREMIKNVIQGCLHNTGPTMYAKFDVSI